MAMTWIDRRLADLKEWKARNAAIRERAAEIYDALWHEIAGHVGDGDAKGFHVITTGAPRKRLVKLEKQNKPGQFFEIEVILPNAKGRVRATGDRVDMTLDLDVCPDGVVCLKLSGKPISIEGAAVDRTAATPPILSRNRAWL